MTSYVFNFIVLHHDHFLRRLLGDSAGSQCCSIDSPKRNSALGPTSPSRSKSSSFCWQPIGRRKIPAEWTATCSVRPPQLSIGHPDAESRYKALHYTLVKKLPKKNKKFAGSGLFFFLVAGFGCGTLQIKSFAQTQLVCKQPPACLHPCPRQPAHILQAENLMPQLAWLLASRSPKEWDWVL